MQKKPDFEKWLRRILLIQDEDRGRCKKVTVSHIQAGKKGSEIISLNVRKSGELGDEYISEMANEIEAAIHDDAEGLGGVQTYLVQPYYFNAPDKPYGRFTIRERAGEDEEGSDIESEPPTKAGLVSQLMRHNEAIMRTSVMGIGQVVGSLRQANARQSELIEKLIEEKLEGITLIEGLRSKEHERRLAAQEAENRQKMISDGFEKVTSLLPIVIHKLGGKKGGPAIPGTPTPMEAMAKGLIETITPEQMEQLQRVFQPHQLMILLEIFGAVQDTEKGTGTENEETSGGN